MRKDLKPALFFCFNGAYSFSLVLKDLFAGITVSIVSVPLALAFAIASGARPEQGLYTAIIAGLIVALFGGSRYQVAGPTGAFVLLIFSTIEKFGFEGLIIATLLAGVILIVMGLFRFGALMKFVPYPVIIGFTSGLALFLFLNQLPDFLGLKCTSLPKDFFSRFLLIAKESVHTSPYSVMIAGLTILIMIVWPRFIKKFPGSLVAIFVTVLLVSFFHLPVETIQDRFGEISTALPSVHFPALEWNLFVEVIPSAIAIALLAGIESLLSAVVADGMTGTRHNSNGELIAQGIANIFSVLFSGIPATGAIARTATNIKNGAHTPVAALVNALFLVLILLILGQFVVLIPLATLAGILTVVAYNMSEWRHFKKLFYSPRRDIAVLLTTFFLTVFTDLITAIEVGIILATLLFVDHAARTSKTYFLKDPLYCKESDDSLRDVEEQNIPDEIEIFEVLGPLFFAAAESFKNTLTTVKRPPKVLIVRLRHVPSIDASGIRALEDILDKSRRDRTVLLLSGVTQALRKILERSGFLCHLGEDRVFSHIDLAVVKAKEICLEKAGESLNAVLATPV